MPHVPCVPNSKETSAVQILAETIEDLVDGAPGSLAFDGSVLLGAKDTTLYVLDSRSGQLLEEVTAIGGRLLQVAAILGARICMLCAYGVSCAFDCLCTLGALAVTGVCRAHACLEAA
jgi:hypothetical protein